MEEGDDDFQGIEGQWKKIVVRLVERMIPASSECGEVVLENFYL